MQWSPPNWRNVRYCAGCLAVYRTDFERCPLDGGELAVTATDPLVGKTIGSYVVDALIGEGGMGRVYRAHREGRESEYVAIKVLIGDLGASALMRQRFAREAEAASRLSHKNIVGVTDFGVAASGLPYLVMDLVEGKTLATELHDGPIAADRVIKIARQLCEGLDHAHGRGVIHRDFKPDNILVVGSGDDELFRIADFGLALSTANDTRLTTTGVACTPAYAAPEQLRGGAIDSRVDLYALGTTMFEMLTGGMLPFDGDIQGTIRSKLHGEAPSLVMIVPEVTPALATLVARLLEQAPARRPRSARSVMVALDTAVRAPKRVIRSAELTPQSKLGAVVTFPAPRSAKPDESVDKRRVAAIAAAAIMGALAIAGLVRSSSPSLSRTAESEPTPLVVGMTSAPVEVMPTAMPTNAVATTEATPANVIEAAPLKAAAATEPETRRNVRTSVAKASRKDAKASRKVARPSPKVARRPPEASAEHDEVAVASGGLALATPDFDGAESDVTDDAARTDKHESVEVAELQRRYGTIGRDLEELELSHGSDAVTDLWPAYRGIEIDNAVASPGRRDEANAILTKLAARIAERRVKPPADDELR